MYGVSVRIGRAGTPIVEQFGTKPETDVREPLVDVFDEKDVVRVIVELPGVEEEDVKTELEGDLLSFISTLSLRAQRFF